MTDKPDIAWTTPEMKGALQGVLADVVTLKGNTHVIKTEEAREILHRFQQTLEILVHGEIKTPAPPRHNA